MAELLDQINQLRALPEDLHFFCPRQGDDTGIYYEEDVANSDEQEDENQKNERKVHVQTAELRKRLTLDAMQILAFDGDEAEPHKIWITERLNTLMSSCDVCVRVFHQSRADWKQRLQEHYDEDNILDFLRVVDDQSTERIRSGLDTAKEVLLKLDPKHRKVNSLPPESTYAFFEGLSSDAVIRNEMFMRQHLDIPFQLVQTRKSLKIQNFLPSMTRFLFSDVEIRQNWAVYSWEKSRRNMLPLEFDWAVRDHLTEAMTKVQREIIQRDNLEHMNLITTFWKGAKLIVNRLTKDIMTDSLRGMQGDIYKLLIDHLPLQSAGFLDLVETLAILVNTAPAAFWDAMDATRATPASIAEQILNSPTLGKILLAATAQNPEQLKNLEEAFIWTQPYLKSMKPANLTPACRAFAVMLFDRLQSEMFPQDARDICFRQGLTVLASSFGAMNSATTPSTFVGQPTVNGMLEMLSTHIKIIASRLKSFDGTQVPEDSELAFNMIQQAFTLEAQSLAVERQLISAKEPSPTETPPSRPIWTAVIGAITSKNVGLAVSLLAAGRNLIGLEPLTMKAGFKIPATVRHFNDRFTLLSESITETVDRLAEFDGQSLGKLFEDKVAASSIICLLFSSTEDTRSSSIELLKVISGQEERRDALQHILRSYYANTLKGVRDSCAQIMRKKAFAPASSLIKTCSDIIDVMCNAQDGILRSRPLNTDEVQLTKDLWAGIWETLLMIFKTTEDWSNLGYDKSMMQEFCRDTMQFADQLFDHCSVFFTAIKPKSAGHEESESNTSLLASLLKSPTKTLSGMSKWLRLRDEFLSTKSVSLISKLLVRLRKVSIDVDPVTLDYMNKVLIGDVRAKLVPAQIAELQRALETHLGRPIEKPIEPVKTQASISDWASASAKLIERSTRAAKEYQTQRDLRAQKQVKKEVEKTATKSAKEEEFKLKRQADRERQRLEREAAAARRKKIGSEHTAEAGSGLDGLGVQGKEQAPKGEGLMHSSDESDNNDDFDEELFGPKTVKKPSGPKTNIINEIKTQQPVKKIKAVRSAKDMRARLAPDLGSLHRTILGWNYFHDGDFPPNSRPDLYSTVLNTFRTDADYKNTFEPLLLLEAWQSFVRAREENPPKPYEIRVVARSSVDSYHEVSSTMTHIENRDLSITEGDIVLLSQSGSPSPEDRHCLARVFRVSRKQAHIEVGYRVMPNNKLTPALVQNSTVFGTKIQSITPLEREYAALQGLAYYDLCTEILQGKPSPLLNYKDSQLDTLVSNYTVNKAQAKAVKSAIDNDAFTLIQGPPGSGKTKTIVAIVGAVLSDSFRQQGTAVKIPGQAPRADIASKKLLVCAPSNAAVDELVIRLKNGVKTLNGQERQLNIVRIGRSEAINAGVQDVMLEELVNKKLGKSSPKDKDASEANRKMFQEHKAISDQLRVVRDQLDSGAVKGDDATKLKDEVFALAKQKRMLGTKIDNFKDNEKTASRDADINRRRAQEQILGEAHVICATLSGSGHDMFRNLNVEFETVIVDEAAQCVEMSAIIPLKYGASKCILVGDPKQLPPTVFSRDAKRFLYEQSLFVRMQANHPKDVHLLDTQYRMHPEISWFPSQTFYDGKLLDGDDMAGLRKRPWHTSLVLGPYRFFDVQGQHQAAPKGRSLINQAEINVALQLYKRVTSDFPKFSFKNKIGIITPYKSQLKELKARFSQSYGPTILEDVDFNTTDAFQGRECEIIIFSCVRASPSGNIGFLQDIRRMNVGLTRAKSSLWVLGNSQSLVRGEFWKKLVDDAIKRDRYTTGDVPTMLQRHSSAYPAPRQEVSYQVPIQTREPVIKREVESQAMSRSGSGDSASSYESHSKRFKEEVKEEVMEEIKQEIKQEIKREMEVEAGMQAFPVGGKQKLSVQDDDVVMGEADSETMSEARTASGRSTPASGRNSATPGPEMLIGVPKPAAAQAGNTLEGIKATAPPAVKRRPKPRPKEVDPFIRRGPPKKPRGG
ncbi:tRNA-splicing endonuclease-like protein [Dendryphion nanum]|uniref:tRNA-splicing endonuclease-like protein n=1 Tax=Dendryphion nanum TaxID=256645 RepID=A0A9P9DCQ8_9PLEO|nr:tRNA-splicing endonuclease-like protein [Dendryphion nanum]